jgi:protein SCO1/2
MAGAAMNKNAITLILALSLGLSACGSPNDQVPLSQAPLAGAAIGGPFTLTDQDGKQRSYSEFDGKYRIIYFGYTNCPDICTPDLQHLMAGLSQFEKANPKLAGKVQPLFITVDPQRDTPAILKQFVTAFHPRLIGLTGSEDQIAATAKSFAIFYEKMEGSSPDAYLMSHSQTPFLMGPDGKPLALMPADTPNTEVNEGDPKLVVAELAKWVR